MCGVTGIFHYREPERVVDRETLERMTRSLAHRGPDGEGIFVNGSVGLGHRRLAIVDLTPTGAQPMAAREGGGCLSYNGEIYNHAELRKRLTARGALFRGSSDTETLLELLQAYGPSVLSELIGIFGFAFWDARHRRLLLVRDPLGVKQLYFHDDGRRVVFASELKALLEVDDVPRELDPEALNQYLHFHTPLFERTFFRGIQQVRPGEYLEIDEHGIRPRVYWQLDGFQPRSASAEEDIESLRALLRQVVSDQLMSDAPVGAFFSGGIDSTAVAAYALKSGKKLRCFGVHFTGQGVIDERPFQEQAAAALGLELELTTLTGDSFPDDLRTLLYMQDQPVIGAAMLPMYHVSRLAAGKVKVCLGGQAADEIFGGYARYALAQPSMVLSSWFSGKKRGTGASGRPEAGATVGGNLLKQALDTRNLVRLAKSSTHLLDWRGRYFDHFARVPEANWSAVIAPEVVSRARARSIFDDTLNRSVAELPTDKLMHWDLQTYLTGLFQQDDRMSMANHLESRVPLADPRLVRFAFHTPVTHKFRGGASKWLLRQSVSDVIPKAVLNRRKVGFDTPAASWMLGRHSDFVQDTLRSSAAWHRGLWNTRSLMGLFQSKSHPYWFDMVWKALCVELWSQQFLDRPIQRRSVSHAA